MVELLDPCVLNADLDEVFSCDSASLTRQNVIEIHFCKLERSLRGDHHRAHILIRWQLRDSRGYLLFSERPHIKEVEQFLDRVSLGEELIKEIDFRARLPVLLCRSEQIEAGLVRHLLLLVPSLEPINDRLM